MFVGNGLWKATLTTRFHERVFGSPPPIPLPLQGLKLAEVAAEIGRSESAVAGLLFRGLKSLHSLLGE